MKKKQNHLGAIAMAGLLSAVPASAVLISGSLSFDCCLTTEGTLVTNTGDLATATYFVDLPDMRLVSSDGDFALNGFDTGDEPVPLAEYSFAPLGTVDAGPPLVVTEGSVVPLWTYTESAITFSFDLTSITKVMQDTNSLVIEGLGIMKIAGDPVIYDDTPGTWTHTTNKDGTALSFSASGTALPDGGSTISLMGLGLLGFGAGRKFLKR